jgi:hypothetical protein
MDRIENTASQQFLNCCMTPLLALIAYKTPLPTVTPLLRVTYQWLFLWLNNSCFEQICHNIEETAKDIK